MSALKDERPSVRFPLPDLLVQGQDNTITAPVYLNAAIVAPTAATVSIFNGSNVAVVSGAVAAIVDNVATYQLTAAATTDQTRSEGWRVEWSLSVSGTVSPDGLIIASNDAALVLRGVHPVVTAADIWRRLRAMNPAHRARLQSEDLQDEISESWTEIQQGLIDQGNRPNLIMSPSSLRRCHLALAIAYVFENMGKPYAEEAAHWRDRYREAWRDLSFLYDSADSGEIDDPNRRRPGMTTLWLVK
jgi:hypothetical protein